MNALILKDLLTLAKQFKSLLIIIVIYSIFGITQDSLFFVSAMPVMMLSVLCITSFSYDNMAKWDSFALTMPIEKKDLVSSKYMLTLLFILTGTVFSLFLTCVNSLLHQSALTAEIFASLASYFFLGLAINAFILPMIYKVGVEKARIGMILTFLAPVILVVFLSNMGVTLPVISAGTLKALLIAAPVAIIALFLLSYKASLAIYLNKES